MDKQQIYDACTRYYRTKRISRIEFTARYRALCLVVNERVTFDEAVRVVAKEYGVNFSEQKHKRIVRELREALKHAGYTRKRDGTVVRQEAKVR